MVITSLDNAKVVEVAKLLEKKFRNKTGKYVIEGERLVRDAAKFGAEIVDIFVAESAAKKFTYENSIVVSDRVFAKMSDTVSSQGILAVVNMPKKALAKPTGNCLVLDGVQDPGNMGTLIRTAAACGFSDVYAVGSVDVFSPKVLRAAMSAHFCLNVWQSDSLEEVFALFDGVETVAADMSGENVFECDFQQQVALVLGNEGNGLSQFAKTHCQKVASLPMQNCFESLNVAVAGSVIMYQIYAKAKMNA